MKVQFVVTYESGISKCTTTWDEYKDAFEWFERMSERFQRVRLYREKTVVEADLLLSTY